MKISSKWKPSTIIIKHMIFLNIILQTNSVNITIFLLFIDPLIQIILHRNQLCAVQWFSQRECNSDSDVCLFVFFFWVLLFQKFRAGLSFIWWALLLDTNRIVHSWILLLYFILRNFFVKFWNESKASSNLLTLRKWDRRMLTIIMKTTKTKARIRKTEK